MGRRLDGDPNVKDSPANFGGPTADPLQRLYLAEPIHCCIEMGRNYYAACGVLGNRYRLVEKILLAPSSMDARNIYRVFIRRRSSILSFIKRTSFQDVRTLPARNTLKGKAGTVDSMSSVGHHLRGYELRPAAAHVRVWLPGMLVCFEHSVTLCGVPRVNANSQEGLRWVRRSTDNDLRTGVGEACQLFTTWHSSCHPWLADMMREFASS